MENGGRHDLVVHKDLSKQVLRKPQVIGKKIVPWFCLIFLKFALIGFFLSAIRPFSTKS